jgi:hypothetical protein
VGPKVDDVDDTGAVDTLDPQATRLNSSRLAVSGKIVFREKSEVGSMVR